MSKQDYSPNGSHLVEQYAQLRWKMLKLHPATKKPVGSGWQKADGLSEQAAKKVIEQGNPIGIQAGEVSGWLSCVDNDSGEAVKLAPQFLPKTLASGKNGTASHYVYYSEGIDYAKYADLDQSEIVCIKAAARGQGHQFVVPPSVHNKKGPYEWQDGFDPDRIAEVPRDDLERCVQLLATSALIAAHLPEKGRHDYSLALAGYLLNNGVEKSVVVRLCHAAWQVKGAPAEHIADLLRNIDDTEEKVRLGEPFKGGPTLNDIVDGLPKKLAKFLSLALNLDSSRSKKSFSGSGRPTIVVNDRPLRDVGDDALKVLDERNKPPRLFSRSGHVIRVAKDEDGAPIIQEASESIISYHLTRAANLVRERETKHGTERIHVHPDKDVIRDVMSAPELPFPPLIGVPRTPFFRPDGVIVDQPGYHASTKLFYVPASKGFRVDVPAVPSPRDLKKAVRILDEAIGDFPYADSGSAANTIALMLTPLMRNVISGPVPLALLDKPTPGTGGSLLAEVTSMVATGAPAGMMSAPRNDDEIRKQLTSALMRGNLLITIDNVSGKLEAPSLSRVLTSEFWEDRILGKSEIVRLPQRATWIASGNNLQIGGDLPRRSYWIRLDAGVERPWDRKNFRHPDLKSWVPENRARLVGALLTMGRAWFVEGRPEGSKSIGSFESWSKVVGGVLRVAGVSGFLGNLDMMYERAADGTDDWAGFLGAWREVYGDEPKLSKHVAADIQEQTHETLRDALPEEFSTDDVYLGRKLGSNFKKREGRPHGNRRLILKRVGNRQNAALWSVVESTPPSGGHVSLVSLVSPPTANPVRACARVCAHGETLSGTHDTNNTNGREYAETLSYSSEETKRVPPALSAAETTVVNLRRGSYDIYIGRSHPGMGLTESDWCNPFKIGVDGTREEVIEKFERYLTQERPDLMARLPELRGKVLACWCKPSDCHGDVLARLADSRGPIG